MIGSFIHKYRLNILFLVIVIFVFSCNLSNNTNLGTTSEETVRSEDAEDDNRTPSEPRQPQEEEDAEDWVLIDQGGVFFRYDPEVILDIEVSMVSASDGDALEEPHPAYMQYSLLLDSGAVSVVHIQSYQNRSQAAAEIFPILQDFIDGQDIEGWECVPELPLLAYFRECFHQQIHANVAFIDFGNGSGVRFVTTYQMQEPRAISNENLAYIFQGITDDQECYVTAGFRLTHDGLEEFAVLSADILLDSTGTALDNYFSDYEAMFNNDLGGFSPSLERFDLIISSFEVSNCGGG